MTDPKVIPGEEIAFDDSARPQADGLEAAVAPGSGTVVGASYIVDNMRLLADKVMPLFDVTGNRIVDGKIGGIFQHGLPCDDRHPRQKGVASAVGRGGESKGR